MSHYTKLAVVVIVGALASATRSSAQEGSGATVEQWKFVAPGFADPWSELDKRVEHMEAFAAGKSVAVDVPLRTKTWVIRDLSVTYVADGPRDPRLWTVSPDLVSLYVARGTGQLRKCKVDGWKVERQARIARGIDALGFSKAGLVVTSIADANIRVLDSETLDVLRTIPSPALDRVVTAPESTLAAVFTRKDAFHTVLGIVDLASGATVRTIDPEAAVAAAPPALRARLRWNLAKPFGITNDVIPLGWENCDFTPDGKHLLTATVHAVRFDLSATGAPMKDISTPRGKTRAGHRGCVSPDSAYALRWGESSLLPAGTPEQTSAGLILKLADLSTPLAIIPVPPRYGISPPTSLGLESGGRRLAYSSIGTGFTVWNATDGKSYEYRYDVDVGGPHGPLVFGTTPGRCLAAGNSVIISYEWAK